MVSGKGGYSKMVYMCGCTTCKKGLRRKSMSHMRTLKTRAIRRNNKQRLNKGIEDFNTGSMYTD